MAYRIKAHKKKILWPITILRFSLPLFCFGFHGQIFLMFTTIFYCRKKETNTSPYLKCRPDHWFNNIKPIGGIAMFLHFLISLITNILYYKPIFIVCNSDLLKKSNSLPDIILFFTKMIIITLFILDKGKESEHWAILSFLVLITGINAYFTIVCKNRQNPILLSLNNFMSILLFSGFLILFFGKVFKFLQFNGSIFLFFTCLLLIILYIILFKTNNKESLSKNYKTINNPEQYLQYVKLFHNIIKNKNNSRNYSSKLKNIIICLEEDCVNKKCPLKKYIKNLEKGFDCEYFLLQFCEKLFQYGISKFNGNIFLKNHYSVFLILEMNNKKKALLILESIKDENFSLETNNNIYVCRRIIEKYICPYINSNNFYFEYRKNVQDFKMCLEKSSLLYYQFLSLLLESNMKITNDIEKMNKTSHQIIKLYKKIENLFVKLINTKTNNIEIINLYLEFVENILKNEEKNKKCLELKKLVFNNITNEIHEKDYSNFNLEVLREQSNSQYLLISSNNKNLGNILDCSMNLGKLLGYHKKELLGNHINVLMPEIFHRKHNFLMNQKSEENNLNFHEGLYKNSIYFPNYIQKDIYCISKSKFLIPVKIKVYLINSEDNELVYIADISNNISFYYDLCIQKNNISNYCIITDQNFMIQSFTANCIKLLKIKQEYSYNYNIINYIKEFKSDYLSSISNNLNASSLSKIKRSTISINENNKIGGNSSITKKYIYKNQKQNIKDLFNQKFSKKCKITWNPPDNENSNISKIVKENNNNSNIFEKYLHINQNKIVNEQEIQLYMEPKKIVLDNELLGYYFFFSKIYNNEIKSYLNYKNSKNINVHLSL